MDNDESPNDDEYGTLEEPDYSDEDEDDYGNGNEQLPIDVAQQKGTLSFDGYKYVHDAANDDGDMVAWKCHKNGCPGTAISFMEQDGQNTIQKLAVVQHICAGQAQSANTSSGSSNSTGAHGRGGRKSKRHYVENPSNNAQQFVHNQQMAEAHIIELTSLLLALDDLFIFLMLKINPAVSKLLMCEILRINNPPEQRGNEAAPPPNDEEALFDPEKLKALLPKSDDAQIAQLIELLRNGGQQPNPSDESTTNNNDNDAQIAPTLQANGHQQIMANINGQPANASPTPITIELLPVLVLEKLIANRNGLPEALPLKNLILDAGILCILLDYLAFSSKQSHRFGIKQLGFIEFPVTKIMSVQPAKKKKKKNAQPYCYYPLLPANNYNNIAETTTSTANSIGNNRLVECLFNVLNQFLLGTDLMPMNPKLLQILRQSCLRNTIREYLMNGNLDDLVGLSSTFGALLELTKTLAQATTVIIDDMDMFKEEPREGQQRSDGIGNGGPRVVSPFNVIFDEEFSDDAKSNVAAGPSTSSAINAGPNGGYSILQLLRNFASSIDDHSHRSMSILAARNAEEGQHQNELVYLSSLGSICREIILLVEEQNQIVAVLQTSSSPSIAATTDQTLNQEMLVQSSSQTISRYSLRRNKVAAIEPPVGAETAGKMSVDDSTAASSSEEEQKRYCEALKDMQFETIQFGVVAPKPKKTKQQQQPVQKKNKKKKQQQPLETTSTNNPQPQEEGEEANSAETKSEDVIEKMVVVPHHFRDKFGHGTSIGVGDMRIKHITRALFSLRSGLQLSYSTAAFVRMSEEYIEAFKVLLTGPAGTPYENGCFEFDFYLDNNFPNAPPKVCLMTTGHGQVRFNPNLYNCGKVCLSLLGTWHGQRSEMWNPGTSTILQVITSIQSLILVPMPYFNEPGYERSAGTKVGDEAAAKYNVNIRRQTVRWAMLDMLRNPPIGFELVVRRHFWLKRAQIRAQLEQWGETKESKAQLENELKKLEQIDLGLGEA